MDCWRMKFDKTRASGARPARATPRWVSIPTICKSQKKRSPGRESQEDTDQ